MLRFIVNRTLDGQRQDLKERIIGIEVFGRSPDYDTSLDPTVRVAATEVRKRLALYYKEPGREQEVRIEVPNGSYVARFRFPEQTSQERTAEFSEPWTSTFYAEMRPKWELGEISCSGDYLDFKTFEK